MARARRKKSGTDVYHIVSRGNNQKHILEEDNDKKYFYGLMKEKAGQFQVEIYAYCIMSNHFHLMVKSDFKMLSAFMRELNSNYAVYYNCKYGESGHVFQGRFYSSCIEKESYMVSCIRYIHNNPVRAYLVSDILSYPYSSAREIFLNDRRKRRGCISRDIFGILSNRFTSLDQFYDFHNVFDNQGYIDIPEDKERYDRERIKSFLDYYIRTNNIKNERIILSARHIREDLIQICEKNTGLSKRNIENILKTVGKGA